MNIFKLLISKNMKNNMDKETAKKLYTESNDLVKGLLEDKYGKDFFKIIGFESIKTFEDACENLNIAIDDVFNDNDSSDEIAYKKLKHIVQAINGGWQPDWNNTNQKKWYPYFNLSSGFGFSLSYYDCGRTGTAVGSRLCFESEKKATYAGNQFLGLYEELLTMKENSENKKSIKNFDYTTIRTFKDACKKLGISHNELPELSGEFSKPIIAAYKLMIIYKAINNGWQPNWGDTSQGKYYPYYTVLSSGFGFSTSTYDYYGTRAAVGSRLCTDTSEKALYIAKTFETEYKDYFLFSK